VLAAGVGHGLAEVAGGGAHQRGAGRQILHQPIGAAALEGADRVERLGLEGDAEAELVAERFADPLRGVEKDRVDGVPRSLDAVQGDAAGGGWGGRHMHGLDSSEFSHNAAVGDRRLDIRRRERQGSLEHPL
jgi:hypothetical protein